MDINKLYEELGRATAQLTDSLKRNDEQDLRHKAERALSQKNLDEVHTRIRLLSEAVALAESGIDPTIAKLTADSSLADQDAQVLASASRSGFGPLSVVRKKHRFRESITAAITPVEEVEEGDGD